MILSTSQLKKLLEERIPEAQVAVRDLTGTSDHFAVEVVSPVFAGKSLIEQHKVVHAACAEHLTKAIHALQIKTRVP
jgi:stress-induced morphogen